MTVLDTIRQMSPKALDEMKKWIETWLPAAAVAGAAAGNCGCCSESSLGAYEGNPTDCQVAPGEALLPRMPESLGPVRYIDFASGNDLDDGLTTATAWKTIDNGGDYHDLEPGWILYCKGTLTLSGSPGFDNSHPGTFAKPVTFAPWPGGARPAITVATLNITIDPTAFYWRFRGFDIDPGGTISTYGHWIEFDDCAFARSSGGGYLDVYGGDNTFIACTFYNAGHPTWNTLLESHGGTVEPGGGDRFSVLNCLFAVAEGAVGWIALFGASDCVIANNTFSGSDYNAGAIELWDGASDNRIVNNIFTDLAGPAIKDHDDLPIFPASGNVAKNNLFWNLTGDPIVDEHVPAEFVDAGSNVEADPLFTATGDYSLKRASPANAAADPLFVPAADLLGANRPNTVAAFEEPIIAAYAFRQINVATIASGALDYMVPDVGWSVASGPAPLGITFASGIWTISVPGIYMVSAGCRFATTDPAIVGGILNFSLFVPGGNIMDTQTALPVPTATLFASSFFEANPANSMMIDTGLDLANNEIHHGFTNNTDVDCDVGYVNVSIWRIAPSAG